VLVRCRRRRGASVTLRVLLTVSFAADGALKLGAHRMVDLSAKIGAGQWFRSLLGHEEMT
jgi:hypothetical protein